MARPLSETARSKMLDAAASLALDVGVRSFTVDEVARRSGVAKTTIYRHFTGKNELIIAALDGLTPVPEIPDTGNFHDDLVIFLGNIRPIFRDDRLRALFFDVFAAATFDEELAQAQQAMMASRAVALTSIVARGIGRGELPPDLEEETIFELIEGPFIVRSFGNPASLDTLDLEELAATIIRRCHV
ncbi:MAG: TetR/AcrR family transcriptional regulator [Actinomycetota bacterium]